MSPTASMGAPFFINQRALGKDLSDSMRKFICRAQFKAPHQRDTANLLREIWESGHRVKGQWANR